ncbi:hypothetical protein KFL_001610060 [Klebsormidium nitens]|uniref:AB hydrolase-1 domain-containing protein n=1 Tax=Klebsormidium nitens TaxID=105231 RepID=A0A1Y1HYQ5_KLENI|nr:hypothetical protein KFL_001610060 [Klebsormidium nitens]|eukprot:GAQ83765.1 hypothetical protein KFL_001610060 [Klebsormidium nitens]
MSSGSPLIRKGYVDTAKGQVHYRRAGTDGATPLILLHQSPESGAMFDAVLPGFAEKGYLAIALDLPGHGLSYRPEEEPDLAALSEGTLEAVKALRLGEAVDYVGHHTGAGVALWIAATHPSSVRRLALWGIPLLNEEWQKKLADEAPPTYSDDGSELAQQWTLLCEHYPGMNFGRKVDFLVGALQTKETKAWAHRAIGRADVRSLIEQVKQPVLAIASDKEILGEATRESVPLFRDAVYHDIPGADLDVADTHGLEFITAVHAFCQEVKIVQSVIRS